MASRPQWSGRPVVFVKVQKPMGPRSKEPAESWFLYLQSG